MLYSRHLLQVITSIMLQCVIMTHRASSLPEVWSMQGAL